jgi:hypothetical protein
MRYQAGGEGIDPFGQLAIAPSHALLAGNQRGPVTEAGSGLIEETADGLADQGEVTGAMRVTERGLGHERGSHAFLSG